MATLQISELDYAVNQATWDRYQAWLDNGGCNILSVQEGPSFSARTRIRAGYVVVETWAYECFSVMGVTTERFTLKPVLCAALTAKDQLNERHLNNAAIDTAVVDCAREAHACWLTAGKVTPFTFIA